MNLKENIQQLMDLQEIDLQVRKLDEELAASSSDLDSRSKKISKLEKSVSELEERREACEKRRRELEAEIEDEFANIKDRQVKLMNVQTNREYQSLLKEIEDGKDGNKQREDETVLLMEEIESINKKHAELKNLVAGEQSLLKEENDKLEKLTVSLNSEKSKIIKNRDNKAQAVAGNVLKRYELLRAKRNGLAIVGVVEGVCQGCNMNIPPQLFYNLLKQEEILSCPICNRMMFHQAEEKAAE